MSKVTSINAFEAHTVCVDEQQTLENISNLLNCSTNIHASELIVDMSVMDGNDELKSKLLALLDADDDSEISSVVAEHSYIIFYC